MIFQQHGIYYGGVLSKQTGLGANNIFLTPYFLSLFNDSVTGSGDVGSNITKKVELSFGVEADPNIYRDILEPPRYTIFVGTSAKTVWIYYDQGADDLGLSTVYPTNSPIFGKVSWPANNGSIVTDSLSAYYNQPVNINVVDIDLSDRTEAYVARGVTASLGTKLYFETQRFLSGTFNKPLADISLAVDVLTAESSLRGGGSFFITLAQPADIHTDTALDFSLTNMSVILEPCHHIGRDQSYFFTYHTKANPTHALVKTYTNPADFQNKYIYIAINKTTGAPLITEGSSTSFALSSTHYPIARSTVAVSGVATDLSAVQFLILNNITSLTKSQEDAALLNKAKFPCGFIQPVEISPVNLANTISIDKEAVASVLGFGVQIDNQNVTLPTPPTGNTGNVIDFVYAEVEFISDPVLHTTVVIKQYRGSSTDLPDFLLTSGILNTAVTPANYTKFQNTYFRAPKPENNYLPYTFAIPLVAVARFNTNVWSATNPNGGVNRPDGKTASLINQDEILVVSPTANSIGTKEIFGETLQGLLKGIVTTNFEQASYSSGATGHFSRYPLQVDYLGTNTIGTNIGIPNGGRRIWSHNLAREDVMSFICQSNVDFSGYVGVFNSTGGHKLTIKVPAGTSDTEIVLDELSGQPKDVRVVWAVDGSPVKLLNLWAVGPLNEVADIFLDTSDASFTSHNPGGILVQFKTRYTARLGFSHFPRKVFSSSINGSANYTDKYWPNSTEAVRRRKVGIVSGASQVINTKTYDLEILEEGLGSTNKYYSAIFKVARQGNNLTNSAYIVDDSQVEGAILHRFNGVVFAERENGIPVDITECKWSSILNRFEIKLASAIPSSEVIYFGVGVVGKELDYTSSSAEISNLTQALFVNPKFAPASGVLFYSTGNIQYGFESLNNKQIIYVEDYACPCTVTGFGTNLLRIDLNITATEYSTLSGGAQANYVSNGLGGYRPTTNAVLKFGVIESRVETQSIVVNYQYQANSFVPFSTNSVAKVVDRGFLIQTNDGSGNFGSSVFSPLDLIFPAVQGIFVTGDGVLAPSPIGLTDVFVYQQIANPFLEGSEITFDGSLGLEVTVKAPTGLAAWCCLVRQAEKLLLFVYEVRDGKLVLRNPNQAFVAELKNFRRER